MAVRHLPLVPVLVWDKEAGPLKNQNLPAREQVLTFPHKYLPQIQCNKLLKGPGAVLQLDSQDACLLS